MTTISLKMQRLGDYWLFHRENTEISPTDAVGIMVSVAVAIGVWLWWYRWSYRNSLGPKPWPLIGSLIEANSHWEDLHDYCTGYLYKSRTIELSLGFGYGITFTVDPDSVEHIMKTNFNNYPKGPRITSVNYDFFGQGIFNVDGDLWRHQRKVAAVEFASSRLRDFSTVVFRDYALRLCAILLQKARSPGAQIDLQVNSHQNRKLLKISFYVTYHLQRPSKPKFAVCRFLQMRNRSYRKIFM